MEEDTPMINTAIIPAAGLGTRMYPITSKVPKELLPLGGVPIIEFAIREAIDAGIEEIVIVLSREKRIVEDYFTRNRGLEALLQQAGKADLLGSLPCYSPKRKRIRFVYQDKPCGLGNAIVTAFNTIVSEPCLVLLPDELLVSDSLNASTQLIESFLLTERSQILTQEVTTDDAQNYGILEMKQFETDGYFKQIVEKPRYGCEPSLRAIIGRYVLTAEFLNSLSQSPSPEDELQFTSALNEHNGIKPMKSINWRGLRFDAGSLQGYAIANLKFSRC